MGLLYPPTACTIAATWKRSTRYLISAPDDKTTCQRPSRRTYVSVNLICLLNAADLILSFPTTTPGIFGNGHPGLTAHSDNEPACVPLALLG
jgi:hypothetical protein